MSRIPVCSAVFAAALAAFSPAGTAGAEAPVEAPVEHPPVTEEAKAAPVAPERLAALSQTLLMADVFAVMAEEGRAYGASLEDQMFPGRGGAAWAARVGMIYDPVALLPVFEAAFAEALANDPEAVAAAEAFFGAPRGQEILKLEIEARRALLEVAVEEAAQVEAERMKAERDPKLRLVRDLIESGDLIEMNVAGAMSASLAFFEGMAAAHLPGVPADREAIMSEVWGQEDSIRAETTNWLVPFLALAYQPLPEADLKAYVEFSASPEGHRLNAALFAGFDATSRRVSSALGRAAAEFMVGNDI